MHGREKETMYPCSHALASVINTLVCGPYVLLAHILNPSSASSLCLGYDFGTEPFSRLVEKEGSRRLNWSENSNDLSGEARAVLEEM